VAEEAETSEAIHAAAHPGRVAKADAEAEATADEDAPAGEESAS
jgi:hypothetical protein